KLFRGRSETGPSACVQKKQVALFQIYDRLFCSYLRIGPCTREATLLLYRITKTSVALAHECTLQLENDSATWFLSVADNLLLVHNLAVKRYAVFDLKDPAFHDADGDDNVVWGYKVDPLLYVDCGCAVREEEDVNETKEGRLGQVYESSETQFVLPRHVVGPGARVFEVTLDLEGATALLKRERGLKGEAAAWIVQFLLRRNGGSEVVKLVMEVVKEVLEGYCQGGRHSQIGMDAVGEVFDLLHKTRFLRDKGVSEKQLSQKI
ncbi:hypothetical protein BC830DRAFT_1175840, partial [Chytriomyces sp. MP71]